MKIEMKVLLYLKRNEQNVDGVCPLMGKITIKQNGRNSSSAQFGCKIKIDPKIWNATSQRCTGKSRVATKTNKEIESQLLLLRMRFGELYAMGDNFTATDIKSVFQGIAATQATILKSFKEHNEEYALRVGVNRAVSTFAQYKITLTHLTEFIKIKYKVSDLSLKQLDYNFMEEFCTYLKIDKLQKPNTIRGHVNRLKAKSRLIHSKATLLPNLSDLKDTFRKRSYLK